ncbi:hypothetical protein IWX47DRAFT_575030 [Phyllosticta citricarpa]
MVIWGRKPMWVKSQKLTGCDERFSMRWIDGALAGADGKTLDFLKGSRVHKGFVGVLWASLWVCGLVDDGEHHDQSTSQVALSAYRFELCDRLFKASGLRIREVRESFKGKKDGASAKPQRQTTSCCKRVTNSRHTSVNSNETLALLDDSSQKNCVTLNSILTRRLSNGNASPDLETHARKSPRHLFFGARKSIEFLLPSSSTIRRARISVHLQASKALAATKGHTEKCRHR